ncbi:DUF1223 domain-containing protein [Ramlibacter ginsenosidimutans]|uniref:DUF1223 domain-containing protein n=1 Tax=Ramlibacter ginsenosidimutans TaxID=502333 RepID=A0A934TUF3_9BURK|nr:DUF1223 domain-containing protein [Ramlibacter ginsenosidimutans]MBK6007782.1 DUF1223 domain-containing protein [Ramlibacter ginsenosidimutans]
MRAILFLCVFGAASMPLAAQSLACRAQSPATRTPVVELYTSEGCSSCPPVDRWLSGLKQAAAAGQVVAEGFHVSYWDSLGWIDRFASPANNARQRQLAVRSGSAQVYTPQLVRDGREAHDFDAPFAGSREAAGAVIRMQWQDGQALAQVTPATAGTRWDAYWTVTEHAHASKVRAGENAGEFLQHDFVVRQFVAVGTHEGPGQLALRPIAPTAGHPQQVNLVVEEAGTGRPLQALSLQCGA